MEQNPINNTTSSFVLHAETSLELVNLGQNLRTYVFINISTLILSILIIVSASSGSLLLVGLLGILTLILGIALIIYEIKLIIRFKHIDYYQSLPITTRAYSNLLWAFLVDIIRLVITFSYTYEITIFETDFIEYTIEPLDIAGSLISAIFTFIAWSAFNELIALYGPMARNQDAIVNISKGIHKIKVCVFLSFIPLVSLVTDFILLYGMYQVGTNLKSEFQSGPLYYSPEYPRSANYTPSGSPFPPSPIDLPSSGSITSFQPQPMISPPTQFSPNIPQKSQIPIGMKKCRNCGAEIVANAQFCSVCGATQK
jgi:hypothetical protein